jgi:hypothetical protein
MNGFAKKDRDADPPEPASLVVYTGWNNTFNLAEGAGEVQSKDWMHTIVGTQGSRERVGLDGAGKIKNPEVMLRSFVSASSSR